MRGEYADRELPASVPGHRGIDQRGLLSGGPRISAYGATRPLSDSFGRGGACRQAAIGRSDIAGASPCREDVMLRSRLSVAPGLAPSDKLADPDLIEQCKLSLRVRSTSRGSLAEKTGEPVQRTARDLRGERLAVVGLDETAGEIGEPPVTPVRWPW